MNGPEPTTKEKIGAVLAYMTLGIWGFIWLLLARRPAYSQKDFVIYHCYQSILVGLLYNFFPYGINIFTDLFVQILGLMPLMKPIATLIFSIGRLLAAMVHWIGLIAVFYCAVLSAAGKYSHIPYISQIINRMLR